MYRCHFIVRRLSTYCVCRRRRLGTHFGSFCTECYPSVPYSPVSTFFQIISLPTTCLLKRGNTVCLCMCEPSSDLDYMVASLKSVKGQGVNGVGFSLIIFIQLPTASVSDLLENSTYWQTLAWAWVQIGVLSKSYTRFPRYCCPNLVENN